jgi:2-polyprenyl-3-methyl-5-hydroxy-6-metoxy-1,4-benzoquinol methylase
MDNSVNSKIEYEGEYFRYSRREMLAFVPEKVRTSLEVGCGAGNFSRSLRERGVECWGLEPEMGPLEEARKNGIKCLHGAFDDQYSVIPKYYFDVVVFNDVLEHTTDPWDVLERTKKLLRPGGYVIASIPNILYFPAFVDLLITRDLKYTAGGIFDKTHLRFFTRKSMIDLFESCGFVIEKIEGIHPYKSIKLAIFNLLTLGYFREMKYMQFGLRARIDRY